jgi:hypothetical protein
MPTIDERIKALQAKKDRQTARDNAKKALEKAKADYKKIVEAGRKKK